MGRRRRFRLRGFSKVWAVQLFQDCDRCRIEADMNFVLDCQIIPGNIREKSETMKKICSVSKILSKS